MYIVGCELKSSASGCSLEILIIDMSILKSTESNAKLLAYQILF